MSLAECPHAVTSMMVPPARTSGGGGTGFGGWFCEAMASAVEVRIAVPQARVRVILANGARTDCRKNFRDNKRGNIRLEDSIVRVFFLLLHGASWDRERPNLSIWFIELW